jgi:hypothetical protein
MSVISVAIAVISPKLVKYIAKKYNPKSETHGLALLRIGDIIKGLVEHNTVIDAIVIASKDSNTLFKKEKIPLGVRELNLLKNIFSFSYLYENDHDDCIICAIERVTSHSVKCGYIIDNVTFPGGKKDKKDLNVYETCIRETKEETGIDLRVCREVKCLFCTNVMCMGMCSSGKNIRGEPIHAFMFKDTYKSIVNMHCNIYSLIRQLKNTDFHAYLNRPIPKNSEVYNHMELESTIKFAFIPIRF